MTNRSFSPTTRTQKPLTLVFALWTFALVSFLVPVHPALAERGQALLPLPDVKDIDAGKVVLGELLFHDVRLSANDSVSCSSCHDLNHGGADGLRKPVGIANTQGSINTPTVFNTVFNISQFWDGRANTLEEQASGPVHNPAEMGSNWPDVMDKLSQDEKILKLFKDNYPDGIKADNIVNAIAMFERTLVTYGSPFDAFLKGDLKAIPDAAKHGYELFQTYGCISCHQGVNVGGNMYQTMGIMGDYFGERGQEGAPDQGRYAVTNHERDRHVFKVPSLRMVAHTAPYFHDGTAKTLEDAIKVMAKYQLDRDLPDADVAAIVDFLKSLAGTYTRYSP